MLLQMKKLLTLLSKLVTLYKKWGMKLARPRVIKLDDGEIKLCGFSKEKADELVNKLSGVSSVVRGPIQVQEIELDEPQNDEDLKELAFSVRLGPNKKWQIVTIQYNGDTKQAIVGNIKDTEARAVAVSELKMELFKHNLI